ncbi:hypothetical protein F5Y00DRAFT_243555 [Daldinia vernicosa]|uniref:uncharacterized protein n=1 Tax=Daldinia vernicosa TaxID=114800 RepID=UPI0020072C80|nr:uncharacterized protein F5Y00DRAFT_243555 [Daldinia vernicosa]KAI0846599.1 hypothetical protein F5Y00DRAFT_243555 [Daldinia vernicosa]
MGDSATCCSCATTTFALIPGSSSVAVPGLLASELDKYSILEPWMACGSNVFVYLGTYVVGNGRLIRARSGVAGLHREVYIRCICMCVYMYICMSASKYLLQSPDGSSLGDVPYRPATFILFGA